MAIDRFHPESRCEIGDSFPPRKRAVPNRILLLTAELISIK